MTGCGAEPRGATLYHVALQPRSGKQPGGAGAACWICWCPAALIGMLGDFSEVTEKLQLPLTSASAVNLLSFSPPSPSGFLQIQNVQRGALEKT